MKSGKNTRLTKTLESKKLGSSLGLGLGDSRGKPVLKSNWSALVLACGSNAFNQCNLDLELNSTSLSYASIPANDQDQYKATAVACGTNLSAAIVQAMDGTSACYAWGSGGLPGVQLRIPMPIGNFRVTTVACGQDHIAFITSDGQAYTWGCGDHGMLGHGNKQAVTTPKLVAALKDQVCVDVSCGGFHTAFIAAPLDKLSLIRVPESTATDQIPCKPLHGGYLYCCGQTKAGQLGIGPANRPCIPTPMRVSLPGECNIAVNVRCGFHHTVVVGAARGSEDEFNSMVYSCGWNEHGRLGVGDEEQRFEFTAAKLPETFLPLSVSAGEQHTIALGLDGSAYAWGSNCSGQLGVGSPSTTPLSLTPVKIPVPEGMLLTHVACGGRHSAAITHCGRLLTWGWNEEGQLGHGSEKNASLPRPCRIPRLESEIGCPVAISAGMSHTLVVVRNEHFSAVLQATPPPVVAEVPKPVETPKFWVPEHVESDDEEIPEPVIEHVAPAAMRKQAIVVEDEPDEPAILPDDDYRPDSAPIRSIRELLRMKEDASSAVFVTAADKILEPPEVPIDEDPELSREEEIVASDVLADERESTPPYEADVEEDEHMLEQLALDDKEIEEEAETLAEEPIMVDLPPPSPVKGSILPAAPRIEKTAVFYKSGQDMDKCLVANSARRAELRKAKKQQSK